MRCLWVTWQDPAPQRDGQQIYSAGLLHALAGAGARIDVLCLANGGAADGADRGDGIRWHVVDEPPRPAWQGLAAPTLPNVAWRAGTTGMRRRFARLLDAARWDAVVIDGFYGGWALAPFERHGAAAGRRPRLVYLSHNHEESLRRGMADNHLGSPLRRLALRRDAAKAGRMERRLVDAADLVTAITGEDAGRFAERRPDRQLLVLTPGYGGRRVDRRRIGADLPRRAVLVGSFGWTAKKMNLSEFLAVADPLFDAAGADLQVIGGGDPAFLDEMRRSCRRTELVGPVEAVEPYLDAARVALVPERTGGGFKLKVLEYVFNRVPVAALDRSVAGTPLEPDDSLLSFPDYRTLAEGVLGRIDDLALLNRLQDRAYDCCRDRFDWHSRGDALLARLAAA